MNQVHPAQLHGVCNYSERGAHHTGCYSRDEVGENCVLREQHSDTRLPGTPQGRAGNQEQLGKLLRPDVLQGVVEALAQSQHGDKVRFLGVRRIGVDAYGLVDRLGKVLGLFTSKRPHTRAV